MRKFLALAAALVFGVLMATSASTAGPVGAAAGAAEVTAKAADAVHWRRHHHYRRSFWGYPNLYSYRYYNFYGYGGSPYYYRPYYSSYYYYPYRYRYRPHVGIYLRF